MKLKKCGISISMTQSGDPLENAIAERANGIIKTEWLYKMKIKTIKELERIILFSIQNDHAEVLVCKHQRQHINRKALKNAVGGIHGKLNLPFLIDRFS